MHGIGVRVRGCYLLMAGSIGYVLRYIPGCRGSNAGVVMECERGVLLTVLVSGISTCDMSTCDTRSMFPVTRVFFLMVVCVWEEGGWGGDGEGVGRGWGGGGLFFYS